MAGRGALNVALVVLAAVPLVLIVADFVLAEGNQALRAEVDQRQHLISQSAQLTRVNQALVRQIAVAAVKSRDGKLRDLLSQSGITINVTPQPAEDGKGG
jgi:hypothetical protein